MIDYDFVLYLKCTHTEKYTNLKSVVNIKQCCIIMIKMLKYIKYLPLHEVKWMVVVPCWTSTSRTSRYIADDCNLSEIARLSEGYSGADITNVFLPIVLHIHAYSLVWPASPMYMSKHRVNTPVRVCIYLI